MACLMHMMDLPGTNPWISSQLALLLHQITTALCLIVSLPQGQFDAQDGVAGTNAWLKRLEWDYIDEFEGQAGQLWYASPEDVAAAGWRRSTSTLTQVLGVFA